MNLDMTSQQQRLPSSSGDSAAARPPSTTALSPHHAALADRMHIVAGQLNGMTRQWQQDASDLHRDKFQGLLAVAAVPCEAQRNAVDACYREAHDVFMASIAGRGSAGAAAQMRTSTEAGGISTATPGTPAAASTASSATTALFPAASMKCAVAMSAYQRCTREVQQELRQRISSFARHPPAEMSPPSI